MSEKPQLPKGAWSEGKDSFNRGLPREDCPYPPGIEERDDWLRGWDAAAARPERKRPAR